MQSLNIKEWKLLELQITQTRHLQRISDDKMSKFNTRQKWENIYQMCTKWEVHFFNVWTIIMLSLNIKKRKLFELQITQTRHHLSIFGQQNVQVEHPSKLRKYSWNVHKIQGAHLKYVNNYYAKYE